ncbi:hypothetical protein HK099_005739, partial [Clydaea vesicula]
MNSNQSFSDNNSEREEKKKKKTKIPSSSERLESSSSQMSLKKKLNKSNSSLLQKKNKIKNASSSALQFNECNNDVFDNNDDDINLCSDNRFGQSTDDFKSQKNKNKNKISSVNLYSSEPNVNKKTDSLSNFQKSNDSLAEIYQSNSIVRGSSHYSRSSDSLQPTASQLFELREAENPSCVVDYSAHHNVNSKTIQDEGKKRTKKKNLENVNSTTANPTSYSASMEPIANNYPMVQHVQQIVLDRGIPQQKKKLTRKAKDKHRSKSQKNKDDHIALEINNPTNNETVTIEKKDIYEEYKHYLKDTSNREIKNSSFHAEELNRADFNLDISNMATTYEDKMKQSAYAKVQATFYEDGNKFRQYYSDSEEDSPYKYSNSKSKYSIKKLINLAKKSETNSTYFLKFFHQILAGCCLASLIFFPVSDLGDPSPSTFMDEKINTTVIRFGVQTELQL